MEKEKRNRLQKATQDARKLLEEEFRSQLLQTYDIDVEKVRWAEEPGAHLQAEQRLIREKLVAWIEHKEAQISDRKEALLLALREMAFTALNRFVALKLMEARELVRPCVSGGLESEGFLEFTAVAQGLLADQESSYRLYLETIFEDVTRELRALFDPRDPASLLWPKRAALLELLDILNRPELAELWIEDETLGWVYQYFNSNDGKEMREAARGGAPRNTRELAVRNQFFTPRYVVEFLTDNTLGRIWYEMRQGNTGLNDRCRYLVRRPNEIWLQPREEPPAEPYTNEALSQEELLRQPVHIPHRQLKDPREIRMLDPACGSMHFGLYAFDLYLEIYKEAWEIAQGSDWQAKQGEAFAPFVAYVADFASKAAFLQEVPRLILQHNIHGIDIDPRATQIARLTLWLRAQRAWREQQVKVTARPAISRSNVVCAEPMPGERELFADFVDQQFPEAERGLIQQLLEAIFDEMKLAGDAGSLLKIEEEVHDAINHSRREWQKLAVHQQNLFSLSEFAALGRIGSSLEADLQNLTKDFWINIEERIYAALSDYAEEVKAGAYQRRLFAEDAAQGFALIDVCRKRYDVTLMNPPFGQPVGSSKGYLSTRYKDTWNDIYAMFLSRNKELLEPAGFLGAITSSTYLNLSKFEAFRRILASEVQVELLIELGSGVMDDAAVAAACTVFRNCQPGAGTTTLFASLIRSSTHESDMMRLLDAQKAFSERIRRRLFPMQEFGVLPFHIFAYWMPEIVFGVFSEKQKLGEEAHVTLGLDTRGNEDRLYRLFWELSISELFTGHWPVVTVGGNPQHFYRDSHMVVNWQGDSAELKVIASDAAGGTFTGRNHYFQPGLTYIFTGQTTFSVQPLSRGTVFAKAAHAIFPGKTQELLPLLGLLNSESVRLLLKVINPNRFFQTAYVKQLPMPDLSAIGAELARLTLLSVSEARLHARGDECSRLFLVDWSAESARSSDSPFQSSVSLAANRAKKLRSWKSEIDELARTAYGIPFSEIMLLQDWIGKTTAQELPGESEILDSGMPFVGSSLLGYLLGTALGRWDIRYATGEHEAPELPDPLEPVPVCPPGQLQNALGLPVTPDDLPAKYPINIPWDGILVDDPNHPFDIDQRLRNVVKIIWSGQGGGPTAESVEHEACEIIGVRILRDYFRRPAGFFADHLKRYSKSRRYAPVYWQLSAGSGGYSAWLYYHRITQDTLFRVLRDFVEPRIQQAEREQFELETQWALSGDAATRFQEAQTLLQDLRILKSELDLVAPLWNPNLKDGVIINHAILWRITPYTPWQKKCKECWDKLVKGDYDWAHLAFHLWPERVIPKCTTDRSLAIAHGLEERLWQETNNGNWLSRQLSEADLQVLIAEHSNSAVKSALERFLAAPPPVAPTRTRASRSPRASGSSTPRRARGSAAVVDAEATRQVLLALTAAPSDGLAKAAIADLIGVEANAITAVIKQLKEGGQIDQLGERRGARYVLSEQGRAAVASQTGEDD